jgi:hypothetical protein
VSAETEAVQRMADQLGAALHAPEGATWSELVAMAEHNVGQCTTNVHNSGERCVYPSGHPERFECTA